MKYFLFAAIVILIGCSNDKVNQCALEIVDAYQNHTNTPHISECMDQVGIDGAYRAQKLFVNKISKSNPIIGFKAGLTSKGSQERFGADQPAAGALFSSGLNRNKATIKKEAFLNPIVETELGFRLKEAAQ